MKSRYAHLIVSAVLALFLSLSTALVQAKSPLPPNSNSHGGYDELAIDWLEWVMAIPASVNPLIDINGSLATTGQSGHVWFLAGTGFGVEAATRTVTVPTGKALFFPIVNFFWVNLPELGDNNWDAGQEAFVREFLAENVDTAQNLFLEIDGRAVPNIAKLRVSSPVGLCTIDPNDNFFLNGPPTTAGPHECLADGYWALLPPLSAGQHTIHFGGEIPSQGFSTDVTYHLTVKKH